MLPSLVTYINTVRRQDALCHTFCVFFVTPTYASQLLDENSFLRSAIRRAYRALLDKKGIVIDALCAVVDKLPASRALGNKDVLSADEASQYAIKPPVAGTGFEGMAYVLLTPHSSVSLEELRPSDNGVIDFITAQHRLGDSARRDTLRLPLANTVFQTGTPSTMFLSRWQTLGRDHDIELISKTNVSHHGIRLSGRNDFSGLATGFSIPLIPLTTPRVVKGCMGNIIREVVDPDGQTVQASSELESVVPRFFRSRGQPAQATVAWALVLPEHLKATNYHKTHHLLAAVPTDDDAGYTKQEEIWERLWRSDPPVWNNLVVEALANGARLHRVLSGGGGWGKKAGLLSLDPVPANQSTISSSDAMLEMVDDPKDFESTLTPVVRAGESIQFFISPKSDLSQEASQSDSLEKLRLIPQTVDDRTWGWEIGTIPSTMDSIPGASWQHRPFEKDVRPIIFRGGFGALTEGGLTLTQHSLRSNEGNSRAVNTTMVDVPFSRFWAVNLPKIHRGRVKAIQNSSRQYSVDHGISSRTSLFTRIQPSLLQKTPFVSTATGTSFGMPRQFSSTSLRQAAKLVDKKLDNWISTLPRPLTIEQLGQALELESSSFRTRSRLSVRTAKAISRELERRYRELGKRYEAIMPAIDARIEFKKKLEMHKIQQHRKRMEEELKRKIKLQALKKPGKSGIYLQPRVKRLVSSYVRIKSALGILAKEVDTIKAALRKHRRGIRKYPVKPQSVTKANTAIAKDVVKPIVRKMTPDHVPFCSAIETYYQYHTVQLTNLRASAMNITYTIRNRVPNSAFRRVASSKPSTSPLQKWRDGYQEAARTQLRRWSAEHIRFYNDIIFLKYLIRRRKQAFLGDTAVPVNRYFAKPEPAKPKTARKPRTRNNTVGIRKFHGKLRIRTYTTKGSGTRGAKPRGSPPVLRIRRYRGDPARDTLLRKVPVEKQRYPRVSDDEQVAERARRAERLRKKREFTSTVGAWLGAGSGKKRSSAAAATVEKPKRVFGAGLQRQQEEAAGKANDEQSAVSGQEKAPTDGMASLLTTVDKTEDKASKGVGDTCTYVYLANFTPGVA
ncbi:hypothetical protein PTNB85_03990 [Pyrenophora teres f. teres]|nr:hypothetical protein PTNB85_03990 [Pyrenophora teres f. teres]